MVRTLSACAPSSPETIVNSPPVICKSPLLCRASSEVSHRKTPPFMFNDDVAFIPFAEEVVYVVSVSVVIPHLPQNPIASMSDFTEAFTEPPPDSMVNVPPFTVKVFSA